MIFKNKKKLEDTKADCIEKLVNFLEILIDDTIRKLYQIQDIQSLGLTEKEKDVHRNVIVNTTVEELLQYSNKLKELVSEPENQN